MGGLREAHGNCPGGKGSVGGGSRGLMGRTRQTGRGMSVVGMTEPGVARVLNTLFRSLVLFLWGVQANADLCKQNTSGVSVPFFKSYPGPHNALEGRELGWEYVGNNRRIPGTLEEKAEGRQKGA